MGPNIRIVHVSSAIQAQQSFSANILTDHPHMGWTWEKETGKYACLSYFSIAMVKYQGKTP